MHTTRKTVLVVGKKESGKTALLERLVHDRFSSSYTSTKVCTSQNIDVGESQYSFVEVPENIHERINTGEIIGDPDVVLLLFNSNDPAIKDHVVNFNAQVNYLSGARHHLRVRWMDRFRDRLTKAPEPKFILVLTQADENTINKKDLSSIRFFILGLVPQENYILSGSPKVDSRARLQDALKKAIDGQELERKLAFEAEEKQHKAKLEAEEHEIKERAERVAFWEKQRQILPLPERKRAVLQPEVEEEKTITSLFTDAIAKLPATYGAKSLTDAITALKDKTLSNVSSGKFTENEGKRLARETNNLLVSIGQGTARSQLNAIKHYRKTTYPYKKCKGTLRIIGLIVGLALGFIWGLHSVSFSDSHDLITHFSKAGKFLGLEVLTLCGTSILAEIGIWGLRNKEATAVANKAEEYRHKRQIGISW